MASNEYYGGGGGGVGGGYGGGYGEGGGYSSYDSRAPPPRDLPYPWRAEWEPQQNRYIFVNPQNGERTFEYPRNGGQGQAHGASYDGGYGGGQYGGPSGPGGYEHPGPQYQQHQGGSGYPMGPQGGSSSTQEQIHEEKKKSGGHGWMGAALGAAAGLAGGAFLMHEGHEVKEKIEGTEERFEEDKYRAEDRVEEDKYRAEENFDNFGRDVEDAPEDAARWAGRKVEDVEDAPEDVARWAGRKVQDVEDIPQDIEGGFDRFGERVDNRWDNAVDAVEDAPEDAARWAGDKVGEVEEFGDRMDNAYDQGQDEGRNDDW